MTSAMYEGRIVDKSRMCTTFIQLLRDVRMLGLICSAACALE